MHEPSFVPYTYLIRTIFFNKSYISTYKFKSFILLNIPLETFKFLYKAFRLVNCWVRKFEAKIFYLFQFSCAKLW